MSKDKKEMNSIIQNDASTGLSSKMKLLDRAKSSLPDANLDRKSALHRNIPPPISKCGTFESPYDVGYVRNWNAKLLTNKVYNIWYKRYASVIPGGVQFQPYDEINSRKADIALQHYLGASYRALNNPADPWACKQKEAYIARYNKIKVAEEEKTLRLGETKEAMRVLSLRSILATKKAKDLAIKEMFGPSTQEKKTTENVCKIFLNLRAKRKRRSIAAKRLTSSSKWHLLKSMVALKKLRLIYTSRIKSEARYRFTRLITIVRHIKKFINVISRLAGDTHSIFSGLRRLKEEREKMLDESKQTGSSGLKQFNPAKYKFNKEVHLSPAIKLILTSPCRQRTNEEVDKIVETLQQIRGFVAYPIAYQKVLAKAAWYIVVPAFRVIIREGHYATSFYFMINGRAKMQKLEGSPYHLSPSEFKQIRILRAQDTFGVEAITSPNRVRSYTVTTDTQCEVLSINAFEFQEVMLISGQNETAPEHIRFLGTLNALKRFPKLKLLEEAPDNINIAHFLSGTVVTTNVAKSEFVYFIFYGTCDVLKELVPHHSVVDDYVEKSGRKLADSYREHLMDTHKEADKSKQKLIIQGETLGSGHISPVTRRSAYIRDAMLKETTPEEPAVTLGSRGSYFANRREYIESRETLRNVFVKEIEKRQNEYMSYRNAFMVETREVEEKCRQISMTLPAAARKRLMGGQQGTDRTKLADLRPSFKSSRRRNTSTNSSVDSKEERNVDDGEPSNKTVKMLSKTFSQEMLGDDRSEALIASHFKMCSLDDSFYSKMNTFELAPQQKTSKAVTREGVKDFLEVREDSRTKRSKRYSKLVGSNMNLLDAVFRHSMIDPEGEPSDPSAGRTSVPPKEEEESHVTLARLSSRAQMSFSRWATVKTAIRGDAVGFEFLDFRSEPFEPPKDVWSIVTSGGATIIMVKKSFLLKYLKKEW